MRGPWIRLLAGDLLAGIAIDPPGSAPIVSAPIVQACGQRRHAAPQVARRTSFNNDFGADARVVAVVRSGGLGRWRPPRRVAFPVVGGSGELISTARHMTISPVVGAVARQQARTGGGLVCERAEWPRTVAAGMSAACFTGLGLCIECRICATVESFSCACRPTPASPRVDRSPLPAITPLSGRWGSLRPAMLWEFV
jgi:hypothetical protein